MGRGLYAREPVFRAAVDRLDGSFAPLLGGSVAATMFGTDAKRLNQTGWAQPALFTLEYALATLWHHWGLTPAIVAGHSIGELAAAAVAGVFELDDAVRLVAARARLTQDLPGGGAMLAADIGAEDLRQVAGLPEDLDLAAVNAPEKSVLSGPAEAIGVAEAVLTARDIRTARLAVSHAFHSARMSPAVPALEAIAASIAMRPPRLPLVSNLSGDLADASVATPGYWGRQLRGTVQFARAIDTIVSSGATLALEMGPRPIL
jgi:polyketide synthase 12